MTTLKSYKVEIEETTTYIFDVQAENEEEAREKTAQLWQEACDNGTYHYYETGDTEHDITEVFDVTGTDDDQFLTTCTKDHQHCKSCVGDICNNFNCKNHD